MNKGFVIMAQNTLATDYIFCAKLLEKSIKRVMPDANVTIITSDMLPYGDTGGFTNDWQIYEVSPYEYTIKLEADMILPYSIDYWWDILKERDLVVSSTIRDYKSQISDCKYYRNFIIDNELPDVYNAITYFKKSQFAEDFFNIVKNIFQNWEEYKKILKCNSDEPATTDWVYAIACHIVGVDNTTLPTFKQFSMVHMKQHINNLMSENWTNELVYECEGQLRINTFPQYYPFHYHIKDFSRVLGQYYG
jgi:hypothetical protein